MTHSPVDPVALTAALVRCPSVTPGRGWRADPVGAGAVAMPVLTCTRVDRGNTANLFRPLGAARARTAPFGFNGHTDVVPFGDAGPIGRIDPFGAEIIDGYLYGAGAHGYEIRCCGLRRGGRRPGSARRPPMGPSILAITGDEEGDATDGTVALLEWMAANREAMSVCLVGEPTCPDTLGDAMKIGRRGFDERLCSP
jgi:succinyl-diaminopimelate desuccinylase